MKIDPRLDDLVRSARREPPLPIDVRTKVMERIARSFPSRIDRAPWYLGTVAAAVALAVLLLLPAWSAMLEPWVAFLVY